MKQFIRKNLESVLNILADKNALIPQILPENEAGLDKDDINLVYRKISDVVGKKKALLIGGTALQRYSNHNPKDIDVLVPDNLKNYLSELEKKGFYGIYEKTLKPFFSSEIYVSHYNLNGKRIRVEFYSAKGILDKDITIDYAISKARSDKSQYGDVYYADPYTLLISKYNSWKNRLFNGRADKDLIDLKEANFDILDTKMTRKIKEAYAPNIISRMESLMSDLVRLVYRNVHKEEY
jgi:hypothetical protein